MIMAERHLPVLRPPEIVGVQPRTGTDVLQTDAGGTAGERLLIVSNRLPITVQRERGRVTVRASSGGLASALRAVRRDRQTLWIGWPGTLNAQQRCESLARILREQNIVPVVLREHEQREFYDSLSNGALWPTLHSLLGELPSRQRSWAVYESVNEQFAAAIANQYTPRDVVWVHDYQLFRVPHLLRRRLPRAPIGFFLHTPFPSLDVFSALPVRRELLSGLLDADLIGFQTRRCLQHFAEAVRGLLHMDVDLGVNSASVATGSRTVRLGVFPISVDPSSFEREAARRDVIVTTLGLREPARRLMLGVDRLDYTKGIVQRLHAFERLLRRNPRWRERLQLLQIAVPSRERLPAYRRVRHEVERLVGRINGAYGRASWTPIIYLYRSIPRSLLVALYQAADVMLVTPLRDGMNLVAKEFVASRVDGDGVLLLSEFAGAASELTDAVIVNPYDVTEMAKLMESSLALPRSERRARMARLRQQVKSHDVHAWAQAFLTTLVDHSAAVRSSSAIVAEGRTPETSALPAA